MTTQSRRIRLTRDRATTLAADLRWFAFGVALASCVCLVIGGITVTDAGVIGLFAMLAMLGSGLFVLIGHTPYPPTAPRRRTR